MSFSTQLTTFSPVPTNTRLLPPGVDKNPCSHLYPGSRAHSEPEIAALTDYVQNLHEKSPLSAYISLHSYRQMWLHPHGYTDDKPKDFDYFQRLSKMAVDEIKRTTGATYTYGQIPHLVYKVSGNAIDWSYDVLGIRTSFTVELRDTGHYGFLLPPEQIKPTSIEVWSALKKVLAAIEM